MIAGDDEDAAVLSLLPISDSPIARLADGYFGGVWIELPLQLAGGGVERDKAQLGRRGIEDAVDHNRLALHFGVAEAVAGVIGPRHFEPRCVGWVDLSEGGITSARGVAAIGSPVLLRQREHRQE